MDLAFWQERWDSGQIGFHEGKPNELLVKHAALLEGRKRVLVPLAGKAQDMLFLASRGHHVVGVELIELACQQFFSENGLPPRVEERDRFKAYTAGDIELLCGDIFDATPARVGTFDAVYDRAALVALDPTTRARYVETLHALLVRGGRVLTVTFSYDQQRVEGPPWSIDAATLRSLFAERFSIDVLDERDAAVNPRMKEAGVEHVREGIAVITRL
jgi:thiopurine S-methyltransferase